METPPPLILVFPQRVCRATRKIMRFFSYLDLSDLDLRRANSLFFSPPPPKFATDLVTPPSFRLIPTENRWLGLTDLNYRALPLGKAICFVFLFLTPIPSYPFPNVFFNTRSVMLARPQRSTSFFTLSPKSFLSSVCLYNGLCK